LVLTNRGSPERPLSDDELRIKFRDNATRALGGDAVTAIEESVTRLESLADAGEIVRPARGGA
ncbi:MAG: MmgE/PrpD family protein, partial [Actinomycetota bacterium]